MNEHQKEVDRLLRKIQAMKEKEVYINCLIESVKSAWNKQKLSLVSSSSSLFC